MIDVPEFDGPNTHDRFLTFLRESEFTFHITGSRYFGGATEESDTDYFAQDSDELRRKLESLGLDNITSHYTLCEPEAIEANRDWDIQAVYRYKKESIQIDIQLVQNYDRRKTIVKGMRILNILPAIPKKDRWIAWNALYNVYTEGLQARKTKGGASVKRRKFLFFGRK